MLFAFSLTSVYCKQDKVSKMEWRDYLHKISHLSAYRADHFTHRNHGLPRSCQSVVPDQELQYHLEIARNAKLQAFPQTY